MTQSNPLPEGNEAVVFDALLEPHRSLSPLGFLLLMTAICCLSGAAGLFFFLVGAWPVVGFLGLDVLLVYLAFRANYRSARMFERLSLTPQQLHVRRVGPGEQAREWRFQPAWLRVEIDDPPEPDSPLLLRSHGHSLKIGAFLTAEERLDLAQALRGALAKLTWRTAPLNVPPPPSR